MANLATIGAAVIGTGFIGTVHVEALRRIGVTVHGVLGSTAGARRGTSRGARRPARRTARSTTSSPTTACDVVHVTSPNDLHVSQARAALEAGKHVVCEKPLAMTADESAELVELAAESGLVNATNFNIRFYPLNQHARELVADGGLGDVRLVTGRYFQDWLLLDSDWNWRLQPDRGGALRAVGDIGSHWLDLMTYVTGQHVASVMADLTTFIAIRQEPTGPVETFSTDRSAETIERRHRDRGHGHDPAPLRRRRAGRREHLPDQPRSEELARSTRSTAPTARGRGTASSPTRCGSAIASGPTRSCSATRP